MGPGLVYKLFLNLSHFFKRQRVSTVVNTYFVLISVVTPYSLEGG